VSRTLGIENISRLHCPLPRFPIIKLLHCSHSDGNSQECKALVLERSGGTRQGGIAKMLKNNFSGLRLIMLENPNMGLNVCGDLGWKYLEF